jgi:D-glycero-D-manno-heptose 1,7-bisphosphate phosphatase
MYEELSNKAVFIDKDGTLIPDIPYNVNPELVTLSPGAADGLRLLISAGFRIVIVSNQSGIAHGYFTEDELLKVQDRIVELLGQEQIKIDGFYFCPHHPCGSRPEYAIVCDCRKPAPGMILQAAKELDIDLSLSWMIGDILDDMEAGKRAGAKTILINNGNETEWKMNEYRKPDFRVHDISEAALCIILNPIDHEKAGNSMDKL